MGKKVIIICCTIAFIMICMGVVLVCNNQEEVLLENKQVIYPMGDIIKEQREMDKLINDYIADKNYTLENPKVLLNPYKLSPLTALVIFQTEEVVSVEVTINGKAVTTMEESKEHQIPIYGLRDGFENVIELKTSNGKNNGFTITTAKYEGDRIKVEKTSKTDNKDYNYFLSPNFYANCIYDREGNLIWYIDGDYAGDIEFLENGHFYISDPYQGTNGVKINYVGFLEMDYLGKIYNQFITPHGYHHELIPLKNNKMLILGANEESNFFEAVIYIMNLETGEVTEYVDLYEMLHKIAPDWIESLGSNFDFVNNSAVYDEETGDILISCRGIGVVMKFNLHTQEIAWMFGNPDNLPDEFNPYLLRVTDNTKYPYGEHSVFLTKDGLVGMHNNDVDQLNLKSDKLSDYLENYTTNVLMKVDEENRTIHTVWEFDAEKKEFSKVGGYFKILENGNKLICYGYSMKQEAYKNPEEISINDESYLNGIVVELDKEDNVVFRASAPYLIYRVYEDEFYREKTKNFKAVSYENWNFGIRKGTEISTKKIKKELEQAKAFESEIKVYINRISILEQLDISDNVSIIFVGENGKSFEVEYKKRGVENYTAFNSGKYGIEFNLESGKYAIYVKKNDNYYDTGMVIEY